jgi:tRNA (guanine-N7-)-methyltransferase
MDPKADAEKENFPNRRLRSFVRRSGRISSAQLRSYHALFTVFALREDGSEIPDIPLIFGNENPLVIEIGFGMGTATAKIANENSGINYLGIEVYRAGIGRLLWEIEKLSLKNIRIIEGDAAIVIEKRIRDNSVSAFHIFFPDPWPKKKHHKRRLIKRPFTDLLASKLLPEGYIYMASDWADYANHALFELSDTPGLVNEYNAFAEHQCWRPLTEFEGKGITKKHEIKELLFVKRSISERE